MTGGWFILTFVSQFYYILLYVKLRETGASLCSPQRSPLPLVLSGIDEFPSPTGPRGWWQTVPLYARDLGRRGVAAPWSYFDVLSGLGHLLARLIWSQVGSFLLLAELSGTHLHDLDDFGHAGPTGLKSYRRTHRLEIYRQSRTQAWGRPDHLAAARLVAVLQT